MKMQGEVDVTISADGSQVEVDAKKFVGPSCTNFMGDVLKSLGQAEVKKKPEFNLTGGAGVRIGN